MRRTRYVGWAGFFAVVAPSGLLALALTLAEQGADRVIGAVGTFAGVAALALSQHAARRPPLKSVILVAKSRSSFARNIARGLSEGLADYPDIKVVPAFPPENADGARWQLDKLRSLEVARADGLVVIPASEDEVLWRELAACLRRGTEVVCVDVKPTNQTFRELGTQPPHFVGSDFARGGREIGAELSRRLDDSSDSHAVLALGPSTSWPACERGSWLLYELALTGLHRRSSVVEISNWDPHAAALAILPEVKSTLGDSPQVLVFAGNDRVAIALDRLIRQMSPATAPGRVQIVGYDGTTSEDGGLAILELDHGVATVDALPVQQGREAAEFLRWAYEGQEPHYRKVVVPPELRTKMRAPQPDAPTRSGNES